MVADQVNFDVHFRAVTAAALTISLFRLAAEASRVSCALLQCFNIYIEAEVADLTDSKQPFDLNRITWAERCR
jgi:hypothetical protein